MVYDPDLIVTDANRAQVVAFLIERGMPPPRVHIMSSVQLANAYHECGTGESSVLQREVAAAIIATLQAFPGGIPGETVIRNIASDEARKAIADQPTQRIEIVSPDQSVTLDGIVHYATAKVIRIAAIGHPVMMVGPAGCGKTTIGEHVAKALTLPFYITNTINDTHELIGFIDGYGNYHATPFRQAFENGGVWIADEIDAWEAGALLTANSALANGYAMFPDRTAPVQRHPQFRMIATANTFGTGADRVYVGRNELDAASLDRFATLEVDYDLNLERMFCNGNERWLEYVWKIRKQVNDTKIRHVVSSRAIAMGSAALNAGLTWDDVKEIYLFKGMSKRDRDKLK